jgi:hypothetical protein
MPENNTSAPAPWVQPTRVQLLSDVVDILEYNPERHDQRHWVTGEFGTNGIYGATVDVLRRFADQPMPDEPVDEAAPVCGTQGCIAGWLAIKGSPPGTVIASDGNLILPGAGYITTISAQAAHVAQLDANQSAWLFNGDRERPELIDALNQLIEDPDAAIWTDGYEDDYEDEDEACECDECTQPETLTYTVTVTSADGEEYTRDIEVENSGSDWDQVEQALHDVWSAH